MCISKFLIYFVLNGTHKVKVKSMGKTKKNYEMPKLGMRKLIARKVGCSPNYVGKVLNGSLGKYTERDTNLVKKIRTTAAELEEMFSPTAVEV